jgi:hypothetical protein
VSTTASRFRSREFCCRPPQSGKTPQYCPKSLPLEIPLVLAAGAKDEGIACLTPKNARKGHFRAKKRHSTGILPEHFRAGMI